MIVMKEKRLKKTILVADDEPQVLDFLERKLAAEGFEVLKALDGREAFEKAKTHSPDLLLLDILMPEMDGSDVAKKLQFYPSLASIPIIFLSGIIAEEKKDPKISEVNIGGQNFIAIAKPFPFELLLQEIQRIFSRRF